MVVIRNIVLFLMCLFHQQTLAQSVEVSVLDHFNQPLSNASIQLLSLKDRHTLHFGFSDKLGNKTFLDVKADSVLMKVGLLGYVADEKRITINDHLKVIVHLRKEDNIQLKEVLITGYPKSFTLREDTITYNLKSVKDGTERNLGDALNKLPGIDVDEKGIVSHQGKKIDQLLVDGHDFFGNKHQMATQNLKADMIDEADLLRNYSANVHEEKGGKTVLNLKMKAEYKNKFIGNFAMDGGLQNKYNNHGNLFRFVDAGNLSIIADFNNLGTSPITIEDYIEMRGGIVHFSSSSMNQVTKLDFNQFPKFIFNDDHFSKKNNRFLAFNYTKTSDKLNVNGYNFLNYSKQRTHVFRNRIFLNDANLRFNELLADRSMWMLNTTYLNVKYTANPKDFWTLQLNVNPNTDESDESLEIDEHSDHKAYSTYRKNSNLTMGYTLLYQRKLNDRWTFRSEASQNYSTNRKDLHMESDQSFLFLDDSMPLFQKYKFMNWTSTLNNRLLYKHNKDNYSFALDYLNDYQKLETAIKETVYTNDIHLTNQVPQLLIKTTHYLTKKWVLATENKLRFYMSDYKKNSAELRYEPLLSLAYVFSFAQKLTLSGGLSHQNFGVLHLAENPILLDYRTVTQSKLANNTTLTNARNISLNYMRFEPLKEWMLNSYVGYTHRKNSLILTNRFMDNYVANVYVFSPFEEGYEGRVIVNKKFRKIPFSVKNFLHVNYMKNLNYLNDHPSVQANSTWIYRLNIFSHFKQKTFQFEAGMQFNKTALRQSYNQSSSAISTYNGFVKLKGLIQEQLIWDVKFTNLHQESPLGKNKQFMVSPTLTLDSRNKRWTYSAYGNNIFNLKNNTKLVSRFTNISIDNIETAMLDGYIVMGLKYHF